MRAIQGHSGGTKVVPVFLDNVEIPCTWSECFYHGCSRHTHSILQSGLIAGGKDAKEGRQTVFFTASDPMSDEPEKEYQNLSKPRKVLYKSLWKMIQDAVHWMNLERVKFKD